MAEDRFDFTFAQQAWRWTRHVEERVVDRSAEAFLTLGDCLADARRAGLHPGFACAVRSPGSTVAAGR